VLPVFLYRPFGFLSRLLIQQYEVYRYTSCIYIDVSNYIKNLILYLMQALNTPVSPAVDTATMRMIFPGVPVRKMVTIPQTIEANIVIVEIIAIARHAFTEAGKKLINAFKF
jgi:hypothetical protein